MTDYANGRNTLLRRPEPGRPVHPVIKETREVTQNVNVDTNAIANAVIKAIVGKMPVVRVSGSPTVVNSNRNSDSDSFDSSESLKKLADAMTVQGNSESKLEGLGKIKETKKDKKETDNIIDILSKLGD